MLQEILENLRLRLETEAKTEFANVSVIGGLDAHVLSQTRRAFDLMQLGEVPREHEFALQRLHDMWTLYADSDSETRTKIVDDSQKILSVLSGQAASGHVQEADGRTAGVS